jgi:hypothetical protein
LNAEQDRANPPTRVGHLDSIAAVRNEASRLYRAARRGEVAAGDASKLATVLALIMRCIEGSDLETRMSDIEERLAARNKA